jgi:hypothetical protein
MSVITSMSVCISCHHEVMAVHSDGRCTGCHYDNRAVIDPGPDSCERCGKPIEAGREGHVLCTWDNGIAGDEIGEPR